MLPSLKNAPVDFQLQEYQGKTLVPRAEFAISWPSAHDDSVPDEPQMSVYELTRPKLSTDFPKMLRCHAGQKPCQCVDKCVADCSCHHSGQCTGSCACSGKCSAGLHHGLTHQQKEQVAPLDGRTSFIPNNLSASIKDSHPGPGHYLGVLTSGHRLANHLRPATFKEEVNGKNFFAPGPGSYNPKIPTRERAVDFGLTSLAALTMHAVPNESRGPGSYEPKLVRGEANSNPMVFKASRSTKDHITVGPGHYNPEEHTSKIFFQMRTPPPHISRIVGSKARGPGTYDGNYDAVAKPAAQFKFARQPRFEQKTNTDIVALRVPSDLIARQLAAEAAENKRFIPPQDPTEFTPDGRLRMTELMAAKREELSEKALHTRALLVKAEEDRVHRILNKAEYRAMKKAQIAEEERMRTLQCKWEIAIMLSSRAQVFYTNCLEARVFALQKQVYSFARKLVPTAVDRLIKQTAEAARQHARIVIINSLRRNVIRKTMGRKRNAIAIFVSSLQLNVARAELFEKMSKYRNAAIRIQRTWRHFVSLRNNYLMVLNTQWSATDTKIQKLYNIETKRAMAMEKKNATVKAKGEEEAAEKTNGPFPVISDETRQEFVKKEYKRMRTMYHRAMTRYQAELREHSRLILIRRSAEKLDGERIQCEKWYMEVEDPKEDGDQLVADYLNEVVSVSIPMAGHKLAQQLANGWLFGEILIYLKLITKSDLDARFVNADESMEANWIQFTQIMAEHELDWDQSLGPQIRESQLHAGRKLVCFLKRHAEKLAGIRGSEAQNKLLARLPLLPSRESGSTRRRNSASSNSRRPSFDQRIAVPRPFSSRMSPSARSSEDHGNSSARARSSQTLGSAGHHSSMSEDDVQPVKSAEEQFAALQEQFVAELLRTPPVANQPPVLRSRIPPLPPPPAEPMFVPMMPQKRMFELMEASHQLTASPPNRTTRERIKKIMLSLVPSAKSAKRHR